MIKKPKLKMKKVLSVIAFMFVVSLSANAQTPDPKEAGKADAKNLSEYVVINQKQQEELAMYFATKYDAYQRNDLSAARKAAMTDYVMSSLKNVLTADQMKKLEANPQLLASLTGVSTATKK